MSESELTYSEKYARWEADVVRRIDAGEEFSEREIKQILDNADHVHSAEGEEKRWTKTVRTVVSMRGRLFAIDWERGLTECCEDVYFGKPFEVERHEYKKTITVVEWNPVRKPGSLI